MQSSDLFSLKTPSLGNFIQSYSFKYHLYIDSHIYISSLIFTYPASHIYISPLKSRISNCLPNISTEITIRHSKFFCPQLKSSGKLLLPIGFSISPIHKDLEIDSDVSSSHIICPIYQEILLVLPSSTESEYLSRFQVLVHWSKAPARLT